MIAGLHDHNEYSLLDGAGTAKQHVDAAVKAGYMALAETNHGTLAGVLHHMTACREGGIMPIVGCEVYYRPNRRVQGQKEWEYVYWHLTLHAKDLKGWYNLMALVSESHKTGFYRKPCVDDELLEKYADGLICLTGCLGGCLAKYIVGEDDRGAESWIRKLKAYFGDDLFVEIMPHNIDEQRVANIEAIRIAQRHGIPIVTTLDAHYPEEHWAPVQDTLLMIATNQTLKKRQKKRDEGEDVYEFAEKTFFHMTIPQIKVMYAKHHPGISQELVDESIRNTLICAMRTTPFLVDRTEKMPSVQFDGVTDNVSYMRKLVTEGLKKRGYGGVPEYVKQTDFEVETFINKDVVNYMLMMWDIVQWAKSDRPVPKRVRNGELVYEGKKKPIMVGPGRGSAAGSTVSWAIGITNVNPIRHKLLFERFLNPARKGLPDIDIDFPPDRVDEVEAYIAARYGKGNVVDIIAHSTFGPRAALTDVGRVLNVPYEHVKAATKTIDDLDRAPLDQIAKVNPAVARLASEQPNAWEIAKLIQGQVARKSEHAGGVLLLPGPVSDYIPVERQGGQKGKLLSAFGERAGKGNQLISDYGYTKADILRVVELTKQQHCVDLIFERTGKRIDLDALAVHDDPYATEPEVMQGFAEGKFVGVFQWSGVAGAITRKAKPKNIFDLAALNALIRPGPRGKGLDQQWLRRMRGEEEITYWHSVLEPLLDYTLGVMTFQEQLVEVVHHLGGLTRAEADNFRKIASKLYRDPKYAREVMGEWYEPIKAGFLAHGIPEDVFGVPAEVDDEGNELAPATGLWAVFLSFSDYSFNLSHADGYSLLAYRDMWLKTYYPREFYAAFLSKGLSQVTKKRQVQKQEAAREARSMGLNIMPPDIHESGRDYTVVEGGIRLGLEAIKHIGPAGAAAIEEHRPFTSWQDFEKRIPARAVNKTGKAALVMGGAFDRWNMRDDWTEDRIDELERELLGMSLTSVYSVQQFADVIDERFWTEDEFDAAQEETRVAVAGEVVAVKEILDSKGETMCFVDLAYGPNHYSCTVFSYLYAEFKEIIHSRRPLLFTGEKNTYKGRAGIKVKSLPPDSSGESVPPIMDLQDYAELVGIQAESLSQDSVYEEDLAEWVAEEAAGPVAIG